MTSPKYNFVKNRKHLQYNDRSVPYDKNLSQRSGGFKNLQKKPPDQFQQFETMFNSKRLYFKFRN